MGLLDYFTKEGKLKRHVRRMSNRDTPPEDREVSAQWLAEERSPKAIYGLITRFDMTMSQQLKDRNEKQYVFDMLVHIGQPTVEPLQQWLRNCKHYAWPLRLLETLEGEEAVIQVVYERLAEEAGKSSFAPEKKKELLVWLTSRRHADALTNAAVFLHDFDEEVRYAAAEVVIGQQDDGAAPLLAAMLASKEEDSNRIKHRLCEVFRARRWPVGDVDLDGKLPPGFVVQDGFIVTA
jgi:hypothetical protein